MKRNGHAPSTSTDRLIAKVYASPRYQGKQVIIIHGNLVPRARGAAGTKQLRTLLKRYPKDTPTIVFVPNADTLILLA